MSKPTSVEEILEPLKRGAGIAQRNQAKAAIEALVAREVAQVEKAYGGCHNCYGKGYATKMDYVWATTSGKRWRVSPIKYCTCDRGKQLAQLKEEKK